MPPSRRQFVAASAAASALLAGCQLLDEGTPAASPAGDPTETDRPTDSETPTSTRPPTPEPSGPARRTRVQRGEGALAVASETTAYVADGGVIRALALDDGTETWRRSPGRVAALCVAEETLVSLTDDGTARAHDGDGTPRWSVDLDGPGHSLAFADGTVLALGADGTVVAIDAREGTQTWRRRLEGTPVGLAADDERAYVSTDDPATLRALALDGGSERWTARPGESVTSPPAVVDGQILVGVEHPDYDPAERTDTPTAAPTDSPTPGGVVAHDPDGTERWATDVPGTPEWVLSTERGPLVGFRGFVFEYLSRVPQVWGLRADGERRWRREQVPFRRRAAATQGVALHVDPQTPEVKTGEDQQVRRGQTALRTGGGETVWSLKEGAATAAAAEDVFVTVEGDRVRARGALSGNERWATEWG